MPTLNQERTARKVKEVIEKHEATDGKDILAFVGYSKGIQKNAGVVFKSKGFQEALKALGFSLESADMVVAKILRTGREENQLKASDQIYKRLGGYAPEKSLNVNFDLTPTPQIKELTEKLNGIYRGTSVPSDGGLTSTLDNKASSKE